MGFTKDGEFSITFHCDSCPAALKASGTFLECSTYAGRQNWIALKRTGFDWTYHCPACAEQAQRDHDEHKRNEERRERMKALNEGRK